MLVNFVVSEDKSSGIFCDIFRRYIDDGRVQILVSEKPDPAADVYHYHRPQMEAQLMPGSAVTVHHDLNDPDPFVSWSRFEAIYKQAETIICLNSNQQDILRDKGFSNTVVIPHGYDEVIFSQKSINGHIHPQKLTLGIISKRYARGVKGEAYLYALLDHLPVDEFRFLLVGEGRSEDAHKLRGLGYEVELHEWLPYSMFNEVYHNIDCLLMLSHFEGGPANLPEAIATGTPVICTNIGMVRDMIFTGFNGTILSGNIAQDAQSLLNLQNRDNGMLQYLASCARNAHTAPTWFEVISRHIDIYETIATQPRQQETEIVTLLPSPEVETAAEPKFESVSPTQLALNATSQAEIKQAPASTSTAPTVLEPTNVAPTDVSLPQGLLQAPAKEDIPAIELQTVEEPLPPITKPKIAHEIDPKPVLKVAPKAPKPKPAKSKPVPLRTYNNIGLRLLSSIIPNRRKRAKLKNVPYAFFRDSKKKLIRAYGELIAQHV